MILKKSLSPFLCSLTLTGLVALAGQARAADILDKVPPPATETAVPAHPGNPTEVDLPEAPTKAVDQAKTAQSVKPEVVKHPVINPTHAPKSPTVAKAKSAHRVKSKRTASAKRAKKAKKTRRNASAKHLRGKKAKKAAH